VGEKKESKDHFHFIVEQTANYRSNTSNSVPLVSGYVAVTSCSDLYRVAPNWLLTSK